VWYARGKRVWTRYLRIAAAIAGAMGTVVLTLVYFVILPPFAWLAKRAQRREPIGFVPIERTRGQASPASQY
jgi:hypothetical protein